MSGRIRPKNTLESWNLKAKEWDAWVGEEGDNNRIFNTDPVLWRFLGDVKDLDVLDAGCGTGYLSRKLARRGARVVAIDFSPAMIEVARSRGVNVDYRVDSSSTLETVPDASVDRIVSNYVLQDLPDLDGAVRSFHRVLRPGGRVTAVFGHPCFDSIGGPEWMEDGSTRYTWTFPYFDEVQAEEAWGPFESSFLYYHRPLSAYWRRFREAGFEVMDFDEPVVPHPRPLEMDEARFERTRKAAFSVAFLLRRI